MSRRYLVMPCTIFKSAKKKKNICKTVTTSRLAMGAPLKAPPNALELAGWCNYGACPSPGVVN